MIFIAKHTQQSKNKTLKNTAIKAGADSINSKQLYSRVPKVHDSNSPVGKNSDARRAIKLPWILTLCSKLCNKVSTWVHDHDAIIARVGDDKVAHVIDGDALRAHELAVPIALAAKDACSGTIGMNHEYVVHVEVGNDDVPFVVERNSSWGIKVATQIAFVAKLSQ